MKHVVIWLKAARLKLHVLGMLPVLVGSLIASDRAGSLRVPNLVFAELITLFVLITTAFANDYADAETDSLNRNFNIFSGGSRVIPDGFISKKQMLFATILSSLLSAIFSIGHLIFLRGHPIVVGLTMIGIFMGIEYSLPPLKISYRGLGELFVMIMYSVFCLYFGYATQTGPDFDRLVLYLSVPLAISMFLMILITEVPDTESDKISGKKTIPAVLGKEKSFSIYSLGVMALYATIFSLFVAGIINKFTFIGLFSSLPLSIVMLVLSLSSNALTPKKVSLLCGLTLILNIWVNVVLSLNFVLRA
jgi:1,4-dihydroxy-2-naphthoate octaprenyltransferase